MARNARYPRSIPSLLSIFATLLAVVLPACKSRETAGPGRSSRPVPVLVAKAVRKDAPVRLQAVGTVEAFHVVTVQSQVSAQLKKVRFKDGEAVTQGQVLFVLDQRPFSAAVSEAAARRDRDRVLADNAKREVARYEGLVGKSYISQEDYDRAKANAAALEASLRADVAAVESASINLQFTTIRAPIAGRTGNVLVHEGNVVRANTEPLVVIRQTQPILVRFSVPEQYVARIRARLREGNPPVDVQPRAPGAAVESGEVTFVDNTVDPTTGTIELKGSFPNEHEQLWPGEYVDVTLRLQNDHDALVVPSAAVQQGLEGTFVYVIEDGVASLRNVTVSRSDKDEAVIASGLETGEVVVIDGQLMLATGAKVVLKTGPGPSGSASPAGSGEP